MMVAVCYGIPVYIRQDCVQMKRSKSAPMPTLNPIVPIVIDDEEEPETKTTRSKAVSSKTTSTKTVASTTRATRTRSKK
jgi:hypothetical protein